MEKCLLITLPREIPNAPFKYDDIIIKTSPIDTVYGTLTLINVAIDNIENPTDQDISSLDWTKTHFLKIHNKVNATAPRIRTNFNASYRFSVNLDDFIPCANLYEIELILSGYQSISGNILSLINSKSKLSFLNINVNDLVGGNNVYGNLKDIIEDNLYNCCVAIKSNEGTITCDIAELVNSYKLRSLYVGTQPILCSDRTTRNSPIYSAIDGTLYFENDIDINNFLVCNSNCRWYYRDREEGRPYYINIIKDGYTPSADALTAIQNLKTNMYLYSTSTERTTGTYFTVKINGVVQ